jgi:hypoxanthine-guanine phosphoribosyltransferase
MTKKIITLLSTALLFCNSLIDSLYAFENNRHLNLDFVKTKRYERMNLGGRKYKITHKGFFLKKTLI